MKFASSASTVNDLTRTLTRITDDLSAQLAGERADLISVFFTSHFEDESQRIIEPLVRQYPSAVLIGCSAEGVVGPESEHERIPAISVLAGSMPGVSLQPFRVTGEALVGSEDASELAAHIDIDSDADPTFLLLGDPFSVPLKMTLGQINEAYPGRPVFGGMASGCEAPGQAVLVIDDQIHRDGMIGLAVSGPVDVQGVVSQGCRPIGSSYVITKGERNVVQELGGKPALARLQEVLEELSPEDVQLARKPGSLFVGLVINEYQERFERGDFLIRMLRGIDPKSGAVAVGDEVRVGSTMQFQLRDQHSADEDLRAMLDTCQSRAKTTPQGALMFLCNGRGTRMWTESNHDVSVLRESCGPIPTGGFFAAGELGPVGGTNFIHGYTASIALFCDPAPAS